MTTESQIEPAELEFTTKPKEQPAEGDSDGGLTIQLDGYRMVARRPKDAVFAMLAATRGTSQKIRAVVDLLRASLTEADWSHVEDRLNDVDDDLDIETVAEMAAALAERWAADTKATAKKPARARR